VGSSLGAVVSVNWSNVTYVSKTSTTLQVVVNPYVERGSPIHDGTFEALANLGADYVRFVPWLPYPQLAVAELQPPTGKPICASVVNLQNLYLECFEGTFTSIKFASYGVQEGTCGTWTTTSCHANMSLQIVQKYCLNQKSCSIPVTTPIFGDPCYGTVKRLAVEAICTPSVNKTFWNFTLLDPLMEDFMNATKDHSVIINFSTTPQWLWNTPEPITYPADPNEVFWSYEQGNDLRDSSLQDIGNYYKRLVGWYTNGGFYDEYNVFHESPYHYDIPMWEVLNEVEAEHSMSPETYTAIYDSIVTAILEVQPNMEFVGLALAFREPAYLQYFLNQSNHINDKIPLDWISYHFYAGSPSRANVTDFQGFFPQADGFFAQVQQLQAIRQSLAPNVKTTIDEIGVILPDDNDPNPAPIANLYWNAAGAMYAYIFGNLITQGIEVLGESQLVGYPTQFPSVSLMDWVTAKPNSRYWVLYLLHENFQAGDKLVQTSCDSTATVYAQGFSTPNGNKILVINKTQNNVAVTVTGLTSGKLTYVDGTTYESPPATISLSTGTFALSPFAVGVISTN